MSTTNLLVAAAAAGMLLLSGCPLGNALAAPAASQADEQAQPKQVQLTQKDIDGAIAAQPDVDAIFGKEDDGPKPSDIPKLDTAAKKHGFDSYDQLSNVNYTIGLALGGIDPASKSYVGPAAVLNEEIKELKADKTVSAKDMKEQLADLQEQLKESDQAEKPLLANVDLVKQNFDKLNSDAQSN